MKGRIVLMASAVVAACSAAPAAQPAQEAPRVSLQDLSVLEGRWQGTLTYRDYSPPHEDVSVPATLSIEGVEGGVRMKLNYPDEPSAYDTSMLAPQDGGRKLNSEDLVARDEAGTQLTLKTQSVCEDDGRPAECDMTYLLSPNVFEMTKMVTLDSGGDAFRRNVYAFERAGEPG